jgi:dolichyl-diphosphooligosaccharide--protein glycosyltransferase
MGNVKSAGSRANAAGKAVLNVGENFEVFFAFVLAFWLSAALRFIEYGPWQAEHLILGGEPLMATHDAYAWLAGAKGVGLYAEAPFTAMIRWIHQVTGMNLGAIGFWLPIMTVPWLALPACLLARAMRMTEAGVIFGVLSGASIGFLVRSRIGFCDTDLVALFFPLSFACALAAWLATQTRSGWGKASPPAESSHLASALIAVLAGLCGALNFAFYSQGGSVLLAVLGTTALLAFCLAPRERFPAIWASMLLVYSLTFGGMPGTVLALALGAVLAWRQDMLRRRPVMLGLALATILVFLYAGLHGKLSAYLNMIFVYAKVQPVELASNASSLKLPDIVQSVREAQNLQWLDMTSRIAGHPALFALGLAGYAFAVFRRPQLLVFLPFLALGVASVKLGNRFAMYGGVALGAGFGFGMAELMRLLGQSQGRRWIAQLALCCVVFWPAGEMMSEMPPVPVLPKVYAQTFLDLRDRVEPDARLWQWWDYGYAGQYYAERLTFGDGGAHSGPWLFPLARVHCVGSPLQANQLMKYFTLVQRDNSASTDTASYYWSNPVAGLEAMGASEAAAFVDSLAVTKREWPADLPAQYLVLSWENLRLAGWIGYYGAWDLVAGTSSPGNMQQIQGEVRIDSGSGVLTLNGRPIPLDTMDVIEEKGTRHFQWPNGSGSHVLINQFSRQVFLTDARMYRSMMVQMLIADPASFEPYFELVDDRYPWTRVYKAK